MKKFLFVPLTLASSTLDQQLFEIRNFTDAEISELVQQIKSGPESVSNTNLVDFEGISEVEIERKIATSRRNSKKLQEAIEVAWKRVLVEEKARDEARLNAKRLREQWLEKSKNSESEVAKEKALKVELQKQQKLLAESSIAQTAAEKKVLDENELLRRKITQLKKQGDSPNDSLSDKVEVLELKAKVKELKKAVFAQKKTTEDAELKITALLMEAVDRKKAIDRLNGKKEDLKPEKDDYNA